MLSNWEVSFERVLKSEGGFVNHPKDPGGMTNLGVTKRIWEEWVQHSVDEAEMRALTPDLVKPMYKARYWDAVKGDDLPRGLDYAMYDFAVNAGPWRAVKVLQCALGVPADGVIGRQTITAANKVDSTELLELFTLGKEAFYKSLDGFNTFGRGWLNRVAEVQKAAEGLIA